MKRFKTFFSLFFLMIFTFNVIISYSLFELAGNEAKNEMAEKMNGLHSLNETTVLHLPLSRLKDAQSEEIWFNNELYDIVKTEVRQDCILVYALSDKKEGALIGELGKQTENNLDTDITQGHAKYPPSKQHKTAPQKYIPRAIVCLLRFSEHQLVLCTWTSLYSPPIPAISSPPPEHPLS